MIHCNLEPLSAAETTFYIMHRLRISGASDPHTLFTSSAVQLIHERSGGIPRQINTLCDRSLLAAYVHRNRQVTLTDVQNAMAELSSLIGTQDSAL